MKLSCIDAHTHAQFAAFKDDYREVVERALNVGVGMVNVGTQKDTSRRAVEIAHEFEKEPVYATIGLHPIHTAKSFHDSQELGGDKGFTSRGEDFDYDYYKRLAEDPKVVAIGECGLDYFRLSGEETKQKQKEAFIRQIKLAREVKKPLMIHCREAFPDLIEILEQNKNHSNESPGIAHFFSGTLDEAKKFLEMGFYFTFGGVITFARDYDEIIQFLPLDRILSETDAPYVAPVPYRGKRNEPVYVIEVVKKLAELKNVSLETMSAQILGNASRAFGIKL